MPKKNYLYKEILPMAKKKKNVPGQGTAKKLQFVGNTPTPETFDILYERYVKAYDRQKGKLRKDQHMYIHKMNKNEFKDYYISIANETPTTATPAATANEIIDSIVQDQRYEYNAKQARWLKRGLLKMGIKADEIEIREGIKSPEIARLNQAIEEEAKRLKREGKTSYEIKRQIGVEFFGSPS